MDSGDSWLVVCILSIVDRVLLAVVLMILGSLLLGNAGGGSAVGIGGAASGSGTSSISEMAQDVDAMKENKQWEEATKYNADGHQISLKGTVDAMYAAGAKEIGFEVVRDFSGHGSPAALYIHLPSKKDARAKILQLRQDWYVSLGLKPDPDDLKDDPNEDWIKIGVRG